MSGRHSPFIWARDEGICLGHSPECLGLAWSGRELDYRESLFTGRAVLKPSSTLWVQIVKCLERLPFLSWCSPGPVSEGKKGLSRPMMMIEQFKRQLAQ